MDPSIATVIASAHFLIDDELWVIPIHDEWERPTLVGWVLWEKRSWLEHSQLGNLVLSYLRYLPATKANARPEIAQEGFRISAANPVGLSSIQFRESIQPKNLGFELVREENK